MVCRRFMNKMEPLKEKPLAVSAASAEIPSASITRSGFVGIIGRPNVGKSTLLNEILGEKLAIASPRPQTTRERLLGVVTKGQSQFAFVDTPGLHRPSGRGRTLLNQFMYEESRQVLADVDVVLLVSDLRGLRKEERDAPLVNPSSILDPGDRYIAEQLPKDKPVILALNKADLLSDKRWLLPFLEAWQSVYPFQVMVPISALTGQGVSQLVEELQNRLPSGGEIFPQDTLTDRSERFLVAERIREQVFLATHQEVPYAVAVTVDAWEERIAEKGPKIGKRLGVRIDATVHVEKSAQKRILVGQRGQMVKDIGSIAREEIKQLLGCGVQLFLFVRVDENWSETQRGLREMGYSSTQTLGQTLEKGTQ